MFRIAIPLLFVVSLSLSLRADPTTLPTTMPSLTLTYETPTDPALQASLERIDADLRARFEMKPEQADVGLLDLQTGKLALIHPDQVEYGASVPKVGILLAYFTLHPDAATKLDLTVRHELGLMAKASNNEMAAKYSHELGLKNIQKVLNDAGFYDEKHGGGIWVGKHYGDNSERYPDPVGQNSHAVTVRQLLRYFLMLEEEQLVSKEASRTMKEIFLSPDIPADDIKFVAALKERNLQILRKWGTWEDWHHDAAIITGPGRHYILVGLTQHPKGDEYLVELAEQVDDLLSLK